MMVCRVVAYRSLSIALGLAPTPSTRKGVIFRITLFLCINHTKLIDLIHIFIFSLCFSPHVQRESGFLCNGHHRHV